MAQKGEKKDISKISTQDLLTYKNSVEELISYYDNLAQASTGIYADTVFFAKQYDESRKKVETYNKIRLEIISELEKRICNEFSAE